MEKIIPKLDRSLLQKELTEEKYIRDTNFGGNQIYIIDHKDSPNLMLEIGRLREVTFRDAGGGTGKNYDIDSFDTAEMPFQQIIVWNPDDEEIIGGYRFLHCKYLKTYKEIEIKTPTSKLFKYSEKFIKEYLPYTIELGRSFVQPYYQPSKNVRKGIFSLDNLWDGLGAIILENTDVRFFFGKITMYSESDLFARELIMYFLNTFFPDPERLVYPVEPVLLKHDVKIFENIFTGKSYEENFKILQQSVRKRNETIPPLVNAYMNLSSTMKTFGTSINKNFGGVEETGILITIADIYNEKKDRYIKY